MVASLIRCISFEEGDIGSLILGEMRPSSSFREKFSDRVLGSSLAPGRCRARRFQQPDPMTLPTGLLLAETAPALARARISAARHLLSFHQRPRPRPLGCLFPSPQVPVHSHPLSDP